MGFNGSFNRNYLCIKIVHLIIYCLFSSLTIFALEITVPIGLLCELLSHPELTVITNPEPEFSWVVNSELKNDYQTGYQIFVATSEAKLTEGKDILWNSGKIKSGQSSNVEYDGN